MSFLGFPLIRAAGTFNLEGMNRKEVAQEFLRPVQRVKLTDRLKQLQLFGSLLERDAGHLSAV